MKTIIVIFALVFTQKCSNEYSLIKGQWIDNDDEKSSIKFDDKNFYMFYNSDTIENKKYTVTNTSCDTNYYSNKNPKKLSFINVDGGECYEITNLSDSALAYRHSASGKLHAFHRNRRE
jgi:hypothetical protein